MDAVPLGEEEQAGERDVFEHILSRVGIANEEHTSPDLGYAAFVDHSVYFDWGDEPEAIALYERVSETANSASLAMILMDTERHQ